MNKLVSCRLLAMVMIPASLAAQQDATSVTLFSSGRVLVRRTLAIALPSGVSTQTVALGQFNPSTLASLDAGVTIDKVNADQVLSEDALLRRNIGASFQIELSDKTDRSATLVSMDPERWQWAGQDAIVFGRPGKINWPKAMIPAARTADVTFRSDRARQSVKLLYETNGSAWGAAYRLFLGTQGRFEGTATIAAGTLDYKDAEVQLLAGDIGRVIPVTNYGVNRMAADQVASGLAMEPGAMAGMAAPPPISETVGEVHIYSLPEHVTFVPGIQTVVPLFDPTPVKPERKLTVAGSLGLYGSLSQETDERDVPVTVAYRLERKLGTPFGDLPLPAGNVSVFDVDKAGRVQLVGQGSIGHTAAGEELLVNSGTAFDVTAKRLQTEYTVSRSGTPLRTVAVAGYRVTLQNAKDSAVTVEVREDHAGEWSVVESSVPAEKRSATRTVFTVPVPAKGTATLTYRLRVVW